MGRFIEVGKRHTNTASPFDRVKNQMIRFCSGPEESRSQEGGGFSNDFVETPGWRFKIKRKILLSDSCHTKKITKEMGDTLKPKLIVTSLIFTLFSFSAVADDLRALNRQLDQKVKSFKRKALKKIEKRLGLVCQAPEKIKVEFRDLPEKDKRERKIKGSRLIDEGEGRFTVVVHREFARAHLIDPQAEITYQLARAVWKQSYPGRAHVAAWFLHGSALHASGMGDSRILFIIADNEKKTTSLVDGWEDDTKNNERDQVDNILFFRFAEKELGGAEFKKFIQMVATGTPAHRAIGDRYPGGFRNLEIKWKKRAKDIIDKMTERGLDDFREVYEAYQEAKTGERAKMTGRFISLLSRYKNAFWEGKARYYLGQCWLAANREDKALAQFKVVLKDLARRTDPRFLDMAKYRLGEMYRERNKINEATKTFKEYLRDFSFGKYRAKSHLALAEIFVKKRKMKKAAEHVDWILSHDPSSAAAKKAKKLKRRF